MYYFEGFEKYHNVNGQISQCQWPNIETAKIFHSGKMWLTVELSVNQSKEKLNEMNAKTELKQKQKKTERNPNYNWNSFEVTLPRLKSKEMHNRRLLPLTK